MAEPTAADWGLADDIAYRAVGGWVSSEHFHDLKREIAYSLAAQRERDAKIAENFMGQKKHAARLIASAIRKQGQA